MALQCNITDNLGIVTTYHKIFYVSVKLEPTQLQATIAIANYISQPQREQEKANNQEGQFRYSLSYVDCSEFLQATPTLTIAAIYAYLKTLPEYATATDV
jgi:hypothetical protein